MQEEDKIKNELIQKKKLIGSSILLWYNLILEKINN